jgi:dienelactone hydrolase
MNRSYPISLLICLLIFCPLSPSTAQQEPQRQQVRERLKQRFDTNGDGVLDQAERQQMLDFVRKWKGKASPAVPATIKPGVTPLYGIERGPHPVKSLKFVMHDDKRNKTLPVKVTYPGDGGLHPVIVWSHGAFGSRDAYGPLVEHWVSHGFVCIQASHSESLSLNPGVRPNVNDPENFKDWKNRPKDIIFLMNKLPEIEKKIPGKIQKDRIGVGGHSYGAHTSQLLAGTQTAVGDHSDPRPRCFALVSPQGTGKLLSKSAWEKVKRPLLIVTGSKDTSGRTGETPEWRLDPFRLSAPGEKYLLWIEDGYHGFGGIAGDLRFRSSGPANPDHIAYIRSATLALWNAYLKDEPAARRYLTDNNLDEVSKKSVTWTIR